MCPYGLYTLPQVAESGALQAIGAHEKAACGSLKNFSVLHKGSGGSKGCDLPDQRFDGETLHQPGELVRLQLLHFCGIPGPGEMPGFHPLGEEEETIAFPDKPFDAVGAPAAEEEQGIRDKNGQMVSGLDNGGEGIHAVTEISTAAYDINGGKAFRVCIPKHGAPP